MATTNFIGLSTTQPSLTGANVTENLWPNYVRLAIDTSSPFSWDNNGTTHTNIAPVNFPQSNIPANTFYTIPYFVIYNASNVFVCAGSINAYMGQNATLSFSTRQFIFDTSKVTFLPQTNNIAFPTVTYPTFTPTFEPAALSTPIQFNQNMRS